MRTASLPSGESVDGGTLACFVEINPDYRVFVRYDRFVISRISLAVVAGLLLAQAQPGGPFSLTVDNIMRGSALVGYEPAQVRWSGDSQWIFFQWKQASDSQTKPFDTYVVSRDGSGLRKLSEEEAKQAPPAAGDLSRDKSLTVYARDGDLFVYDGRAGKTRQITRTNDPEVNPHFLPDGRRIYFTRASNLFVISLNSGELVQMTDIHLPGAPAGERGPAAGDERQGQNQDGGASPLPPAGEPPKGTPSQEYLKKEQKELLETVKERAARREEQEARRKRDNPRKPYTLQARQSVTTLLLSPDERYVIATITETPTGVKNTVVPNYVTESAYAEDIRGRPLVGDNQMSRRLAVVSVETGAWKWVDHGQKTTQPAETGKVPAASETGSAGNTPATERERNVLLGEPVWSEDGTKAVLSGRSADNKDRWILALDPATAKTRVLASDHDDAWIAQNFSAIGWMKNDREVYFLSERTGYSHLYAVPWDGGAPRALTSGNWEVTEVRQSKDRSWFRLEASKDSPYDHLVYQMGADGGPLTRLTPRLGKHSAAFSPDEKWLADIYSYTNKPSELYVQESLPQAEPRKLTSSPAPEFSQFPWQDVPIVTFTARDGVAVPARLFKPENFPKGGPGVVFVHGSGYAQNVDRKWSSYSHEYLFDHLLMERGFIVIDVDYRGSAGYGRNWRTAIYDHMGGKDLDDIVDAARYLVSQHGANPQKLGVYGGSYGGFITLMAMFTQPDVFAAGAALRPVSDWALYNQNYTANILNMPQDDADAYRRSSPIYFAQNLKGALLIAHGMVDTNVEFQDTVRLVQRLIELRKENWQLAVYPVENHGFVEPTSWADEYKRVLALFEKNLK